MVTMETNIVMMTMTILLSNNYITPLFAVLIEKQSL